MEHDTETPPARPADTHSYKGWLNSDAWWKRALAVVGYNFIGQLIISLAIAVALLALVLLALLLR